jgi:diguanylate cyclase (GGDEF)-like protein
MARSRRRCAILTRPPFWRWASTNTAVINETYGRAAADKVQVEVGRRLDDCLRVSDLVGRLGDDRFGVLLPHCSDEYVAVAKILAALHSAPIVSAGGLVSATASIGAASFGDQGSTSHEVITRAERPLPTPRTGRDRHVHTARARITTSASAAARNG